MLTKIACVRRGREKEGKKMEKGRRKEREGEGDRGINRYLPASST
jgi:hypothetical protein